MSPVAKKESTVPLWAFRICITIIGFFLTFYFYHINTSLTTIAASVEILMREREANHLRVKTVENQTELNRLDIGALYRNQYNHQSNHK